MKMSNKTYDVLKQVVMLGLPALATLVIAIAEIWELPYGPQIAGTITAIATFLGACLRVSTANYNKEVEAQNED